LVQVNSNDDRTVYLMWYTWCASRGFDRIWPVTGGVILEQTAGKSLWFASSGPNFITPAGDFSTLTLSGGVYTRTMKDGTKCNFNSAGRLTSFVDRNNNTTAFGYDGSNRLSTITDFNSLVTNLAYNAAGKVSTITDPASRVTTLGYNASNQLTSITDPDNAVMGYGYDSAGRMTGVTDPRLNNYTITHASTKFTYRVTPIGRPAPGSTENFTPYQTVGIPIPPAGSSQMNAAASTLAVNTFATYTDGRGNAWKSY